MADLPGEGVIRSPRDVYGDTFTADLLEQYKLLCPLCRGGQRPSHRLQPIASRTQCRARGAVRDPDRRLRSGLVGGAGPCPRHHRLRPVAPDHPVAQELEPNQVRGDSRSGAAFSGCALHARMALGGAGTRQRLSRRHPYRAMDPVDVPCSARGRAGRLRCRSGGSLERHNAVTAPQAPRRRTAAGSMLFSSGRTAVSLPRRRLRVPSSLLPPLAQPPVPLATIRGRRVRVVSGFGACAVSFATTYTRCQPGSVARVLKTHDRPGRFAIWRMQRMGRALVQGRQSLDIRTEARGMHRLLRAHSSQNA